VDGAAQDFAGDGVHRDQHGHHYGQEIDHIDASHHQEVFHLGQLKRIIGSKLPFELQHNKMKSQPENEQKRQPQQQPRQQDFSPGGFAEGEFCDGQSGVHNPPSSPTMRINNSSSERRWG